MHWTVLLPLLTPAAKIGAALVGTWLLHRIGSPNAHERAATLALIANAVVAVVVTKYPLGDWTQLLRETISEIERAAGLPTTNEGAILREATRALRAVGITSPLGLSSKPR
jgi:hypothetical protein